MTETIGIVGIGNMGSKIANNIIKSGRNVIGYDILPDRVDYLESIGGRPSTGYEQVGREAEIVILSLPKDNDVTFVVGEILQYMNAGKIIVDMSTVSPETTIQMEKLARQQRVDYVDAPVLGRPENCGQWTLPSGGDPTVVDHCKPVLSALAKQIVHVGKSGSGNVIKILNNIMVGVNNALMCEVISLCKALDMDPKIFYDTVVQSPAIGVSRLFEREVPRVLEGNLKTVFSVDLMLKDLTLASHLAEQKNKPLFLTPAAQLVHQLAKSKGLGEQDMGSLVKLWEVS